LAPRVSGGHAQEKGNEGATGLRLRTGNPCAFDDGLCGPRDYEIFNIPGEGEAMPPGGDFDEEAAIGNVRVDTIYPSDFKNGYVLSH
jgi:hypothetical protein